MSSGKSLPASYFESIFAHDGDPWDLASSAYEADKHAKTIAALGGRHYRNALEIGCAGGVLTRRLAAWCDSLLAIDISRSALSQAQKRCGDLSNVSFRECDYPRWSEAVNGFDLIVVSEVAYYWASDDLVAAASRLRATLRQGGDLILVHWTGATDYPQTGDDATESLLNALADSVTAIASQRTASYRLDLWRRR
jgi:cyclopropane fatty-acyl-phospholipid synthase-like methyltransferase